MSPFGAIVTPSGRNMLPPDDTVETDPFVGFTRTRPLTPSATRIDPFFSTAMPTGPTGEVEKFVADEMSVCAPLVGFTRTTPLEKSNTTKLPPGSNATPRG